MDVEFSHGDYKGIHCVNCVVYCDPPYKGTKYYGEEFEHEEFYDWCRGVADKNIVLISEYQMPEDFICIWSKVHKTSLDTDKHYDRVEKLFVHEKNFDSVKHILEESL